MKNYSNKINSIVGNSSSHVFSFFKFKNHLYYFLAQLTWSSIVDSVIQIEADEIDTQFIHDQSCEHHVPFIKDGFFILVRYRRIHEGMGSNEVEDRVRERFSVVHTLTGPRFRNFVGEHRKPGAAARRLFFEFSTERLLNRVDMERANRRAHQSVRRRGKSTVKVSVIAWHLVNTLWK